MLKLELDYSRFGKIKKGQVVPIRLLKSERDGVMKGSRVILIGDSVEDRPARVVSLSPDKREIKVEVTS